RQLITYINKGSYFPFVTTPGKVELFMAEFVDRFSGARFGTGTPSGGAFPFLSTPAITLDVKAGEEYYLQLSTTFSAKLKPKPAKEALKDLRDKKRSLAYEKYEKQFSDFSALQGDPIFARIKQRMPLLNFLVLDANGTSTY